MIPSFIHTGLDAGRRVFLKIMATGATMLFLGLRGASHAYAQAKDYLSSRIQSVYAQDKVMKFRKSQDNPMVKKLYSQCLTAPMCPKSEKYLHAVYTDRSAGIKNLK
jgi:ferredoxin hydrogenase small subunit